MTRTPLLQRFADLARDCAIARAKGLPLAAVPELRARARDRAVAGVTRRGFLAAAAAGVASLALPRVAFAKSQPKIAIVGAGIAGLSAALRLQDKGVAATVFESSSRIGGRMFSLTNNYFDGQTAEWCGELIDSGHVKMRRLAKRFDLKLVNVKKAEPTDSEDTYFIGGGYYAAGQAEVDFLPVFDAVVADEASAPFPTTFDHSTMAGQMLDQMTVAEWIDSRVPGGLASKLGKILELAYTTEYGAATTDQSALNLIYLLAFQPSADEFEVFGESDEKFRIDGGNQQLPRLIAQSLHRDVQFQHALAAVRAELDGRTTLVFDTPGGTLEKTFDFVILTLPFAVLRTLDLTQSGFDAMKQTAIDQLGRGHGGKCQMQFTDRLWRGSGPWPARGNGSTYSDLGYQSSWEPSRAQDGKKGILNCFTGGPGTDALMQAVPFANAATATMLSDANTFLPQLDQVFPGVAGRFNGKAIGSVPHLSEQFRCSYSYYRVGQYTSFGGSEKLRQGNVAFAGEHTSTDFQGFMEGGAEEGTRAAQEILHLVKSS